MFNLNIFENQQKEPELSLKSNKNDKFWLSFENSDQSIICDLKYKYHSMVIKKWSKSLNEKNEIEMPNIKEAICMIRVAKTIANWWKHAIKHFYFDGIEILQEEEDIDEITTSSARVELELNDKSCVENLNDLLKKFDFNKHINIQKWQPKKWLHLMIIWMIIKNNFEINFATLFVFLYVFLKKLKIRFRDISYKSVLDMHLKQYGLTSFDCKNIPFSHYRNIINYMLMFSTPHLSFFFEVLNSFCKSSSFAKGL